MQGVRAKLTLLIVPVVAFVWLIYPTEARKVERAAEAIAAAASSGERALSDELVQNARPSVGLQVVAPDLALQGRDEIVTELARSRASALRPVFRLEHVEVMVEGRRARLNSHVVITIDVGEREQRDERRLVAVFEKTAGAYVLVSAELGPSLYDQPEARP